jgi:N-acetylglucosaminyldiphosphoundecaprenol N-acetyl-beta-D-mannosaminyltransferase
MKFDVMIPAGYFCCVAYGMETESSGNFQSARAVPDPDSPSPKIRAMASTSLCDGNTASALARAGILVMDRNSGGIAAVEAPGSFDNLLREVHGVLGVPLDVTDMAGVVQKANAAAANGTVLFLSTINLNFLVASQTDPEFRRSLLLSDFCTADGMPVVWIARLLGVPIEDRIAGSDLVDALRAQRNAAPLKLFLFGGGEGVAAAACKNINAACDSLVCVGSLYPGFGSVEDMSAEAIINEINASNADFLVAALGAAKGQAWLVRNYTRLRVPVRAHLGAAINFQAGTVQRAPRWMRQIALEWLWRIGQEPHLWRRYVYDGLVLAKMLALQVLPLVALRAWHSFKFSRERSALRIDRADHRDSVVMSLDGSADRHTVTAAIASFQAVLPANKNVVINCAGTRRVDTRFLGLLLMLDRCLRGQGLTLTFVAVPPRIRRFFCLNGFEFLLRGVAKA